MAPSLRHPGGGSAFNYKKIDPFFFFCRSLRGEAGGASHGVPRRHRERVLPEAPAQGGIQLRVSPRATRKKKRRRRKRERADGGPQPRAVTKRTDLNFTTSSSPPQRARGLLCVVGDKGQRPRAVLRARLQGPEPRRKVPQLRRYPGEGAKPARPFSSLHSRLPLVSHYTATPQTAPEFSASRLAAPCLFSDLLSPSRLRPPSPRPQLAVRGRVGPADARERRPSTSRLSVDVVRS